MNDETDLKAGPAPPLGVGLARNLARLAVLVLLAFALRYLYIRAEQWILESRNAWAMPWLILVALVVYALLVAIPFVPGIEIGLTLLATGGPRIAPLVWLATAAGLTLAYLVGNKLSLRWLHPVLRDLRLVRACRLLERFEALPPEGRAAMVAEMLPARVLGWVVKYRYLHLAILINIPGNTLIGGGGGIALISSLSGAFRTPLAILIILAATAPVPLAIRFFGWQLPWV